MWPMKWWEDLLIAYGMAELVGLRKWATSRLINEARIVIRNSRKRHRVPPPVVASGIGNADAEPFASEAISETLTNVAHSVQSLGNTDDGEVYLRLTPSTA
jgi:hypothetical protein